MVTQENYTHPCVDHCYLFPDITTIQQSKQVVPKSQRSLETALPGWQSTNPEEVRVSLSFMRLSVRGMKIMRASEASYFKSEIETINNSSYEILELMLTAGFFPCLKNIRYLSTLQNHEEG